MGASDTATAKSMDQIHLLRVLRPWDDNDNAYNTTIPPEGTTGLSGDANSGFALESVIYPDINGNMTRMKMSMAPAAARAGSITGPIEESKEETKEVQENSEGESGK
jgi:hypothetical protein